MNKPISLNQTRTLLQTAGKSQMQETIYKSTMFNRVIWDKQAHSSAAVFTSVRSQRGVAWSRLK